MVQYIIIYNIITILINNKFLVSSVNDFVFIYVFNVTFKVIGRYVGNCYERN